MKATNAFPGSAYMEWVKTLPPVAFNLANSGVKNFPLGGLRADWQALHLSGPAGYGYPPLVAAIAAKCQVPADCVVTAQGTSMANYLVMAALLKPGDDVLIEHPGYPLLWEAAQFTGANVRFFERDSANNFAIDLDSLKKLLTPSTRLIVLTNLHNPSCTFADQDTLRAVGELAQQAGGRVLVDEVYLDVLFADAPETSFKLGPGFVVTNSLTKVYGLSGLRCGWILAEPPLARQIYRLNDLFGVNNPYVTDQLSVLAFARLPEIASCSRQLLEKNRALANDFLSRSPAIEQTPSKWGTVLFPRISCPADELCRILRERYDTVVTPGRFFGAPDRVRIGIGGETAVLAEGLERVRHALADLC